MRTNTVASVYSWVGIGFNVVVFAYHRGPVCLNVVAAIDRRGGNTGSTTVHCVRVDVFVFLDRLCDNPGRVWCDVVSLCVREGLGPVACRGWCMFIRGSRSFKDTVVLAWGRPRAGLGACACTNEDHVVLAWGRPRAGLGACACTNEDHVAVVFVSWRGGGLEGRVIASRLSRRSRARQDLRLWSVADTHILVVFRILGLGRQQRHVLLAVWVRRPRIWWRTIVVAVGPGLRGLWRVRIVLPLQLFRMIRLCSSWRRLGPVLCRHCHCESTVNRLTYFGGSRRFLQLGKIVGQRVVRVRLPCTLSKI